MPTQTLTLRDLNRATSARQMLLAREKTTVPKALTRLLAIQAQWPKPPFAAFWSRLEGFARDDLNKLARKNAVVRGTAFRGTIFVMRPDDWAAFRGSIAPTLERAMMSIVKKGIPIAEHDGYVAKGRAFFEKQSAPFEGFRSSLTGVPNDIARLAALIVRMRVPLLQVASDVPWGWHQTCDFALAESLIEEEITTAPAHDALVLRYLAALGPGSVADAQNFTGIPKLKDSFERLREKLVTFKDDRGKELFDLPKAPRPGPDVEAPARFLPDFDNVILGHSDRRRFVADEHKPLVYQTKNLVALRTFTLDGFVAGTWKAEKATLTVSSFAALSRKHKSALEEEGLALLKFLEPEARAPKIVFSR